MSDDSAFFDAINDLEPATYADFFSRFSTFKQKYDGSEEALNDLISDVSQTVGSEFEEVFTNYLNRFHADLTIEALRKHRVPDLDDQNDDHAGAKRSRSEGDDSADRPEEGEARESEEDTGSSSAPPKRQKYRDGSAEREDAPPHTGDEKDLVHDEDDTPLLAQPTYNIFVANLAREATKEDLRNAYLSCGPIHSATIVRDKRTGQSKNFGFVHFLSEEGRHNALNTMRAVTICGRVAKAYTAENKNVLFVGNLAREYTNDELKQVLEEKTGHPIQEVVMKKGFAFVTYVNFQVADRALRALTNLVIEGRRLTVEPAKQPKGHEAPAEQSGDPPSTLYVKNLAPELSEEDFKRHFSAVGTVVESRIVREKDSNKSKGFGFVEYAGPKEAAQAQKDLHESELGGRKISVEFSNQGSRKVAAQPERRGGRERGGRDRERGGDRDRDRDRGDRRFGSSRDSTPRGDRERDRDRRGMMGMPGMMPLPMGMGLPGMGMGLPGMMGGAFRDRDSGRRRDSDRDRDMPPAGALPMGMYPGMMEYPMPMGMYDEAMPYLMMNPALAQFYGRGGDRRGGRDDRDRKSEGKSGSGRDRDRKDRDRSRSRSPERDRAAAEPVRDRDRERDRDTRDSRDPSPSGERRDRSRRDDRGRGRDDRDASLSGSRGGGNFYDSPGSGPAGAGAPGGSRGRNDDRRRY